MDRGLLAERLLRVICGRGRASEIAGDLLELAPASSWRFSWMVLQVVVGMCWRWAAGIIVAAASTLLAAARYGALLRSRQPYAAGHDEQVLVNLSRGGACMLACTCVLSVVVLNGFRFGFRDRLNAIGSGMILLLGGMASLVWHPWVGAVAAGGAVVYAAVCLGKASLRGWFGSLAVTAGVYAGVFWGLLFLPIWPPVARGWTGVELSTAWLVSLAVAGLTLMRTRRWLLPKFVAG